MSEGSQDMRPLVSRVLARIRSEVRAVGKAWSRYECTSLSASIAFYGALSVIPFLVTLVAGIGAFFEFFEVGQSAHEHVLAAVAEQFSPEMAVELERIVADVQVQALANGPIAVLGFILTASLAFAQIDRGFERIWDVKRRSKPGWWHAARRVVFRRLRSLAIVACWGILVLFIFAAGLFLRGVREIGEELMPIFTWSAGLDSILLGFSVNCVVFTCLYFSLSKERVGWMLSARSGLLAALIWEGGSKLVAIVMIGDKYSTLGLAGSFVAVLVWVYLNAMVLFLGALLIKVRFQESSQIAGDP